MDTAIATTCGGLNVFRHAGVRAVTSTHEFDFKALFKRPFVVILEIPEDKLAELRLPNTLFLKAFFDAAIAFADSRSPSDPERPLSAYIDDLPALGYIRGVPERCTTFRSRRISLFAGVQSFGALRTAYGSDWECVHSSFGTCIVMPGVSMRDAEYFANSTGRCQALLPIGNGGGHVIDRNLLMAADIANPPYFHPRLGKPATFFTRGAVFQAYLTPTYMRADLREITNRANGKSPRRPLRETPLEVPPKSPMAVERENDNKTSSVSQIRRLRHAARYESATNEEKAFWDALEAEMSEAIVLRLLSELRSHNATIAEFRRAHAACPSDNLCATLHFMVYLRYAKVAGEEFSNNPRPEANGTPK